MLKPWFWTIVLALGIAAPGPALGQAYPTRSVRIVVPFAAGSATDIMARIIADELRATFDQPFVIDNKPGASAQIGAEIVAKAPPDGYTLFVTTNTSHSANPFLFKKLPYDPVKDFTPIANIMRIPVVIVVDAKLPVSNLNDLVALTRARRRRSLTSWAARSATRWRTSPPARASSRTAA